MFRKLKNWLYGIPFGMKGAENEMLSQKSSSNTDVTGVHETVKDKRLSTDLLKGEVTEQVEELRYRDYTSYRESKKYRYRDGERAEKLNVSERDLDNFEFSQSNSVVCENVGHELNRIGQYSMDRYTVKISYADVPKFKLEAYLTRVECKITGKTASLSVFFEPYENKYNITTKAFLNELKRVSEGDQKYMLANHEFCNNIKKLVFTTYKAYNEDDFILYTFNDLKCTRVERLEKEYVIEYVTDRFVRNDLTAKFYCDSLQKKYDAKEKKDNASIQFGDVTLKEICSECGKAVTASDASLTKDEFGVPLCAECVEKRLSQKP